MAALGDQPAAVVLYPNNCPCSRQGSDRNRCWRGPYAEWPHTDQDLSARRGRRPHHRDHRPGPAGQRTARRQVPERLPGAPQRRRPRRAVGAALSLPDAMALGERLAYAVRPAGRDTRRRADLGPAGRRGHTRHRGRRQRRRLPHPVHPGLAGGMAGGRRADAGSVHPVALPWREAGVSEHGVLPGLWPIHGDGVLARQGDLVLLIHPAGGAFTDRLLDLLAAAARAGESGLRFTDMVSAEFDADASAATAAAEYGPAVVAFGPVGGGTAVAVYGTGWAEITTAYGAQRLTAGEPYGRLRCVLPSTLIKVRAGVQPVAGDDETDPYLRLADGVVRAVALLYAPAGVKAETADQFQPQAPAPAPSAELS